MKVLLAGGLEAKEHAARLLGEPFTVETSWVDARGNSREPRYFAKITLSDGSDLGVRLAEAGLARDYGMREGLDPSYLSRIKQAAQSAKSERRGLWRESSAEPQKESSIRKKSQ